MRKVKIIVKNLFKSFQKKDVLKNLDLNIYESESLSIIGESGSGKSILTRCIIGLIDYDHGTINFEEYKTKLYSAVLADTLDSLGYHKQTLTPGIKSIKPDVIICGLARVGLYMPIYHDDENTNVYEHEIALIDSLRENEIAVLCCHGNEKIAPWGELLSTRATYLKSAGCLTDGCVRDTKMINEIGFPVFAKGTNPVDTKFRGKMMMADVPGEIANVYVESGDLVFGDNDGVVIVPSKVIDEVIRKALEKVSSENTVRDELKKGDSLTAVFEKHKIL